MNLHVPQEDFPHTLTALTRLINLSSLPEWQRLLLGGLAASALLHLLVLDAWREPGGRAGKSAVMPAKISVVRLHALESVAALERAPLIPAQNEAERAVPRFPAAATSKPDVVSAVPVPAMPESRPEVSSVMQAPSESGFSLRPLTPAEGRVAYRLALLLAAASDWPAVPAAGMLLELSLAESGKPEAARVLRGTGDAVLDQAWLACLQAAAARASVPEVLRGREFALELEFQP